MNLRKPLTCAAIVLAFAALGACTRNDAAAEEVTATVPPAPEESTAPAETSTSATATTSLSGNSAPTGTGPESGTLAPGNTLVRADTNGDGLISREEADADDDLRNRFSTLDTNGDGSLSSDEWLAATATDDTSH